MKVTALAADILARAARPIPRYGSTEWMGLPENDLRRVASVIVAAEAWRDHCSPETVAFDLMGQVREENALVLARIRETSEDVRVNLPTGWVDALPHAELVRRRVA